MQLDKPRLILAASRFPIPPGSKFSYGTAGFRSDASILASTVFRAGVLAALRSLCQQSVTGVMITASHNPIADNGVKVADPEGGMLAQDWEPFADALANAQDSETLVQLVEDFFATKNISCKETTFGKVVLARDTRPSGHRLLDVARQGVEAVAGVEAVVLGVLTTPQLHWMVRAINKGSVVDESQYFSQLSNGFRRLLELNPIDPKSGTVSSTSEEVIIDAANGVGAEKLFRLQESIGNLKMQIRNSGMEGEGALNEQVGADFVQKEKVCPRGFSCSKDYRRRCVSFDGDADRLVYFYMDMEGRETNKVHLLDGDKILTLFSIFIKQQLEELFENGSSMVEGRDKPFANFNGLLANVDGYGTVQFGVVQTAYANGASTKYLQDNLGLEVARTATGVKHLHEKAAEYDVGIYFEANGHGMVLIKQEFLYFLKNYCSTHNDHGTILQERGKKVRAAQRLLAVGEVVNQAVGDALSGMLLVELILQYMNWSIFDWQAVYSDLPSRQLKVRVVDRTAIKTTNAETRVASPSSLQDAINVEVERIQDGRAFVRPSGTEDVVRVYAEARTQDDADNLAHAVAAHVHRLAGGVGAQP